MGHFNTLWKNDAWMDMPLSSYLFRFFVPCCLVALTAYGVTIYAYYELVSLDSWSAIENLSQQLLAAKVSVAASTILLSFLLKTNLLWPIGLAVVIYWLNFQPDSEPVFYFPSSYFQMLEIERRGLAIDYLMFCLFQIGGTMLLQAMFWEPGSDYEARLKMELGYKNNNKHPNRA